MVSILSYEFIRENTRIHPDIILKYAYVAEQYVLLICNKTLQEIKNEYGCIPRDIMNAIIMMAEKLVVFGEPHPVSGLYMPSALFRVPYVIKILLMQFSTPGIDNRISDIEKIFHSSN